MWRPAGAMVDTFGQSADTLFAVERHRLTGKYRVVQVNDLSGDSDA